ncbi:MAG: hypothetical protein KDA85_07430, partial [Planctomycetaceae bacterium]|nr:hypothetical protein [Planctomycetaceae bacterium]
WTGGNIFKARVFPIEPHSEKRVKITYTQVLPLRGNRFRYNYALKSELLQTNPLRELNVRVLVNSAIPLSQVESPTHTCRVQQTKHSAQLEFSAQEYTPTRDFEVVCEVDHRENDVLVVPHRRGDDGYFLMQLMPPTAEGSWTREVIPDGDPLNLIILCDTSGSMDAGMRQTQAEFVSTLLSALGEQDRVLVAATDVATHWAMEDFVTPSEEHMNTVRAFLDERVSLGWTDLDQAFSAVMKKVRPGTQIVYVGDGIVATSESNPAAFVNRLQQLYRAQAGNVPTPPVLHAVSVGSSYESVVLKGIAALGGGSVRQISGETTSQETAFELLNEIAQPGLKNVQLEFRGIEVGAIYPPTLPNIAAGTQQIIVGRYRPQTGAAQSGEVIVTGLQDGKPVRYAARIELANDDEGNSFIPRLWARGRLDALLQEATTPQVRDEIIGLSEEFHIITPYTSLLVLETDADRERFGVKRRFEIRDGERFFAEGKNNASYELQQQQMQQAGNWRLGLRRKLLTELAGLGRDGRVFASALGFQQARLGRSSGMGVASGLYERSITRDTRRLLTTDSLSSRFGNDPFMLGTRLVDVSGLESMVSAKDEVLDVRFEAASRGLEVWDETGGLELEKRKSDSVEKNMLLQDFEMRESLGDRQSAFEFEHPFPNAPMSAAAGTSLGLPFSMPDEYDAIGSWGRDKYPGAIAGRGVVFGGFAAGGFGGSAGGGYFGGGAGGGGFGGEWNESFGRLSGQRPNPHPQTNISWLSQYFPQLPPVPPASTTSGNTASEWPAEAIEISTSLLRGASLKSLSGGLRIQRQSASFDDNFQRLGANSVRTELWSPDRWLTRDGGQGAQSVIHWLDQNQRGVCSEAFLLGRVRQSHERDFQSIPLYLSDYSLSALHQTFRNYRVEIEHPEQNRTVLRCVANWSGAHEVRFTIDTARHVLLSQVTLENNNVTNTIQHSDFIQVAGSWWATRIETTGADQPGRVKYRVVQTVEAFTPQQFAEEFQQQQSMIPASILMPESLPTVRNAKQAIAAGTASAWDHFSMLLHWSMSQKWEEAFASLRQWETSHPKQFGADWIRIAVELAAGRNEDARQRLTVIANRIAGANNAQSLPQADFAPAWSGNDLFLATHTLATLYPITGWNEYGEVVSTLKPVYSRQSDAEIASHDWNTRWLQVLDQLGQIQEALELHTTLLDNVPGDISLRIQYANRLVGLSRIDEALKFLQNEIADSEQWNSSQQRQLRTTSADILEGAGRYDEVLTFCEQWAAVEDGDSDVFERYLAALVLTDRNEDAERLVTEWLQLIDKEGELTDPDKSRVRFAVQFCFGNIRRLSRYYYFERHWLPHLYQAVRHCLDRNDRDDILQSIVNDQRFSQSDEADQFRGDVLLWLLNRIQQPAVPGQVTENV